MSNDSHHFEEAAADGNVPLYEAKFIGQFDHRRGSYESRGGDRGFRVLPDTSVQQHQDVRYAIQPFYWVDADIVRERLAGRWSHEWFVAFKDVTAATNERTVVASAIPMAAGVNHKLPLLFTAPDISSQHTACLLANLNSVVFDYFARQKVGGLSLALFILKQLPAIPPSDYSQRDLDFIVSRVLELTYTAYDMKAWAADVGYEGLPFRWDPNRRALLRAELDAYFARLYGLTHDDVRFILDPQDLMGQDYPSETFRVLKTNEQREFGEYRTRRLVLESWDRLERSGWPSNAAITAS